MLETQATNTDSHYLRSSIFNPGKTFSIFPNQDLFSKVTVNSCQFSWLDGEIEIVILVCIRANVAHHAGAYHGFRSTKRLGVFLLPPGWDASPSQGYPQAFSSPVPIYTPGWREAL